MSERFRRLTVREMEEMIARGLLNPNDPRLSPGVRQQIVVDTMTGGIYVGGQPSQGETARLEGNVRNGGFASQRSTFPISGRFVGEETGRVWGTKVMYLTEAERQSYRIHIKDGKLYEASGKLFDTRDASTHFSGAGRAIFVMSSTGELYASKVQDVGKFHHSSLLAGADVMAAGEMEVEEGMLKLVTRKSGHYQPSGLGSWSLRKELQAKGVDTGNVHWGKGFE